MKLKLFIDESPPLAEQQVNEWLLKSPIEVHHVAQSQSEKNGRFVFVISIYYHTKPATQHRYSDKQVQLRHL